jgi:hypothetical protein
MWTAVNARIGIAPGGRKQAAALPGVVCGSKKIALK